ncbi:MAG: EAL domain-containing protein, partial [Pseudohongiellaceae bacterium]
MPDSLLLARQPIFDRSLNIAAYELLFRSDAGTVLKDSDANLATTQVLLNAFTDLDIDALLEDHKAYVNFTRDLILHPPPFNKDKYVIEVLESIHIDDELVQQLRRLKRRGYTIALDDFEYSKDWDAVLKLADIVKLDVLAMSREQLIAAVDRMKTYGVKLLAEKVESHEMFHFCCDLGFQLFQGYFLCRPRPIRGNRISRPQLAAQSLLSAIQNPELEIEHLSSLVAGDSVMSAGVLRIENASNGGDVEHAMVDSA